MIYSISSEVDVFCVIIPLKKSKSNGVINRAEGGPSIGAVGRNHDKLDSHAPPKAGHRHSAQPTVAMRNIGPVLPNLHNFGGGGEAGVCWAPGSPRRVTGEEAWKCGSPCGPPSSPTQCSNKKEAEASVHTGGIVYVQGALQMSTLVQEFFTGGPWGRP